jgi:alpha-L-fucosidase
VTDDIESQPFQTDTCIGDWHYKRGIRYKTPKTVVDLLVDIVSRNGNLLLNVPLPASGMPDDEELEIVAEITKWMKVNSEAIYSTRPWKMFGEGPGVQKTKAGAGMNGTPEHFNESQRKDLTGDDIRFTTKEDTLYAFSMGHNPQETRIPALSPARNLEERKIKGVELLGSSEPLQWKVTDAGLVVASPRSWPSEHAVTFKIQFEPKA